MKRGKKLKILTHYPKGKKIIDNENNHIQIEVKSEKRNDTVKPKKYHKIKKGDTLFSVSKKYNLSVDELKDLNHLRKNKIAIGQKLRVN